eukprot:TRINITY_DN1281_c0_g1_i7.p1 TRINITY_DN1281_c0_g1~~TRINITY_DN1281_c0_g1_i7.p1  ORF type:complete len:1138 (+),score=290.77 TRINITY_DN1281_c0_g1_i7:465-3416(+)
MIKEAFEDFQRYREDKEANTRLFRVVRGDLVVHVASEDLTPGDIVLSQNGEVFPADIVLLSSSEREGTCFVETATLDGESNLKIRRASPSTMTYNSVESVALLNAVIQCESPNHHLYHFSGKLSINGSSVPLNPPQLLQRGAQLRNTEWTLGVVVYAGMSTKMALNALTPQFKTSHVETMLNKMIYLLFGIVCVTVLLAGLAAGFWRNQIAPDHWYLSPDKLDNAVVVGFESLLTYFVLTSYMIPISLYVTVELVRVFQALFMWWDISLSSDDSRSMKVTNSSLNDELGLIEFVFSDKTGTLTMNQMKFAKCFANDTEYNVSLEPDIFRAAAEIPDSAVRKLLLCMAVCHTVVPEPINRVSALPETLSAHKQQQKEQQKQNSSPSLFGRTKKPTGVATPPTTDAPRLVYNSQSPDETALVECAAENGVRLLSTTGSRITLNIFGDVVEYELLHTLEFNADRKRMSVIVKDKDGNILIFCKGADNIIHPRLNSTEKSAFERADVSLTHFGKLGLRTLVLGMRIIPESEYQIWKEKYSVAETAIQNREQETAKVSELIEHSFLLLGCTAIEDRLQEFVSESVEYLLSAGIGVWVLTGDKLETAIEIGFASGILQNQANLVVLSKETESDISKDLESVLRRIETMSESESLCLVVSGHTLEICLGNYQSEFVSIGLRCRSVICARSTPLQKARVVTLMRAATQKVCLAIGDGANDVSMIQAAHVGVGILGLEGTQASRAADFSIHQFRHLVRLLSVHGRYSYLRITGLTLYSLYKNMAFCLPLVFFGFFSGYTGQALFDSWILTCFNIFFASVPPMVYGVFEKDLSDATIDKHPSAYTAIRTDHPFNLTQFFIWLNYGLWHALVTFFGVLWLFGSEPLTDKGDTLGMWSFGLLVSTGCVLAVLLKIALTHNLWNWLTHFGIWGSMVVYILFLMIVCAWYDIDPDFYFVFFVLYRQPYAWLVLLLLLAICLIPDVAIAASLLIACVT